MSFATAVMVDTYVPRGTNKGVRALILDDQGDAYNMTDHTATLRIAESWAKPESLLEKEGTPFGDPADGRVVFDFAPEDTEDLMVRSYDLDIFVTDDATGDEWQAFHGTLGITPTLPSEVAE